MQFLGSSGDIYFKKTFLNVNFSHFIGRKNASELKLRLSSESVNLHHLSGGQEMQITYEKITAARYL